MRYQSNLTCPDLSPHFKLLDPPKQIFGHDAPSDPDFEPGCTFWTHDEAAILFACSSQMCVHDTWMDIGCRFGWTSKYINWGTNSLVICVDPALSVFELRSRFIENTGFPAGWVCPIPSEDMVFKIPPSYCPVRGVVIDGNHDSPEPLEDAKVALQYARQDSVIMFHDYWGKPIRDAVDWLVSQGWQKRIYFTPNGVACCWRGLPDFVPPDHVRDPAIDWRGIERMIAEVKP